MGLGSYEPVCLEEKNPTGTIFDKFIRYSDNCLKAIVIYSGRDFGGSRRTNLKRRARENVVFELGYFVGKIGIENTLLLLHKNIKRSDLPSDLSGIEVVSTSIKSLAMKIKEFLEC